MTTPKQATPHGLDPHVKVRVVLPGALLHLAAWSAPVVDVTSGARTVTADWIADPAYGDTIGFIEWDKVVVTWRAAE